MPTKRTRRTRHVRPTVRPEVWAIMNDEEPVEDGARWIRLCIPHDPTDSRSDQFGILDAWKAHRDEIVATWAQTQPGTRPSLWWTLSGAPRQPKGRYPECWFDGHKPEPRNRLGGTGMPVWEKWRAVVPYYSFGIPASWEGLDPADPPTYESQAEYLERHGLLLPGERARLRAEDFAPVIVPAEA